ncbi:hypothetical protein LPJ72_003482 [Coemansia sp. Benny D160-2]|nr:hypothetical protein LPJ72_003482 [Coemansia sp. Benny D160-2]
MDLTGQFRQFAREHATAALTSSAPSAVNEKQAAAAAAAAAQKDHQQPYSHASLRSVTNPFLSEAYIIAKHLSTLRNRILHIRPAYLNLQRKHHSRKPTGGAGAMRLPAAASPGTVTEDVFSSRYGGAVVKLSDPERDEIDRGIKTTVRQMLRKIQSLNELGEQAVEATAPDDGTTTVETVNVLFHRLVAALDPRNASASSSSSTTSLSPHLQTYSKRDCLAALQSSVVWWLNARLQDANQVHSEMQELYLRQKLERQHTVLSRQRDHSTPTTGSQNTATANTTSSRSATGPDNRTEERDNDGDDEVLKHLSDQELAQLQMENTSLVSEFENALDRVRETQRSIAEISALQTQLANELNAQMQLTEKLYDEAVGAVDDVSYGNEYLVSAKKHQASARKWVLFIFIVLSLVLMFLDWFD